MENELYDLKRLDRVLERSQRYQERKDAEKAKYDRQFDEALRDMMLWEINHK